MTRRRRCQAAQRPPAGGSSASISPAATSTRGSMSTATRPPTKATARSAPSGCGCGSGPAAPTARFFTAEVSGDTHRCAMLHAGRACLYVAGSWRAIFLRFAGRSSRRSARCSSRVASSAATCLLAMHLDFEIQRCTRRCAATDRPLEPGEVCYSVLEVRRGGDRSQGLLQRRVDRAAGGGVRLVEVARSRAERQENQAGAERRAAWNCSINWPSSRTSEDMRYVLALLLVRRRVLRLDGPATAQRRNQSSPADVETHDRVLPACATPRTK